MARQTAAERRHQLTTSELDAARDAYRSARGERVQVETALVLASAAEREALDDLLDEITEPQLQKKPAGRKARSTGDRK